MFKGGDVAEARGSDSPVGTPLSSSEDTRQPRREKPPAGLTSSWRVSTNKAGQCHRGGSRPDPTPDSREDPTLKDTHAAAASLTFVGSK